MADSSLGPWIISGIALAQVWVIALIKRLRRAKVELYPTGNLEIGFSGFGPTIGVIGTWRALNRDTFVKSISVRVTRCRDASSHTFNWRAFRDTTFSFDPSFVPKFELASSFLLTANTPTRYSIFFVDDAFTADVSPRVAPLVNLWNQFREEQFENLPEEIRNFDPSMVNEILFSRFIDAGRTLDAYTTLDRAFYWTAGKYDILIQVESDGRKTPLSQKYHFTLSEDDVILLRQNSVAILRAVCGQPTHFNFANPQYE